MKIYIWWAFFLLSCVDSSKKSELESININSNINSENLDSLKPKEINDNLISFSYRVVRAVRGTDLKTYQEWPINNFYATQNVDTITIKFNSLQSAADWHGKVRIKQDSMLLINNTKIETSVKALIYYEFTYKIKNPDRKKFKINSMTEL